MIDNRENMNWAKAFVENTLSTEEKEMLEELLSDNSFKESFDQDVMVYKALMLADIRETQEMLKDMNIPKGGSSWKWLLSLAVGVFAALMVAFVMNISDSETAVRTVETKKDEPTVLSEEKEQVEVSQRIITKEVVIKEEKHEMTTESKETDVQTAPIDSTTSKPLISQDNASSNVTVVKQEERQEEEPIVEPEVVQTASANCDQIAIDFEHSEFLCFGKDELGDIGWSTDESIKNVSLNNQVYQDVEVIDDLESGLYNLKVEFENGCARSYSFQIAEVNCFEENPIINKSIGKNWVFSSSQGGKLTIINRAGQIQEEIVIDSESEVTYTAENLGTGLYVYLIELDNGEVHKGKLRVY